LAAPRLRFQAACTAASDAEEIGRFKMPCRLVFSGTKTGFPVSFEGGGGMVRKYKQIVNQ